MDVPQFRNPDRLIPFFGRFSLFSPLNIKNMKKRKVLATGFFILLAAFVGLTAFKKSEKPDVLKNDVRQTDLKGNYYGNFRKSTLVAKLTHPWKVPMLLDPETLRIHSDPEIGDGGTVCKWMPYRVWVTGSTGTTTWNIGGGAVTQVISPSEVIVVFNDGLTDNGGSGWIDAIGFDTDGNPDFFEWAVTESQFCDTPDPVSSKK